MVTGYERLKSGEKRAAKPVDVTGNEGGDEENVLVTAGVGDGARVGLDDEETITLDAYQQHSRRAVLTGGVAIVASIFGWRWVRGRPTDNRIPDVLRRGHEANEFLWRGLSRESAMAPTFDRSESSEMRVNGRHGIESDIDLDSWELMVLGPDGEIWGSHDLAEIKAMPKETMTVKHKCVEGWSHIVTWGGTPFANLVDLYADQLGDDLPEYVYLETPDGDYYVGMDMASMMHSQTMLTYELQDEPLSLEHGAPLRLSTPNKYGIKTIKRIGIIQFMNEQPTDYWYERGYDWYAQL
jgi:DMSO/TMAO reductase YedYZ molybdopterin-dependent catalytic subunit